MISDVLLSQITKRYGIKDISLVNTDFKRKGAYYGTSKNIQYKYEDKNDSNGWSTITEINLYEFIHNCKIWALSKGYVIQSEYEGLNNNKPYSIIRVFNKGDLIWDNYSYDYDYYDEPTGIIKACEWILTKCQNQNQH